MTNDQLQQQQRLVAALREPAVWPDGTATVTVRETHISWIFLAGVHAWKLKKAVDFGFLDYSTLDRRRESCAKEVRLNRRTAPMIYLGVAAVTGTPEAPVIDGPGAPLDHLVKMRRFDEAQLLSRRLDRGALGEDHLARLAGRLAEFQDGAEPAAPDSPWGTPATVWHFVQENFDQIRAAHGPDRDVDAVAAWSRACFAALAPRIDARRESGRVRDGHGDLHLNNIVLVDDEPVPFDCIEFNDALRIIDVMSDLAFLFMDLQHRERPDLATFVLNEWLFHSGDYAGVALLRFFAAYRAMVRAKVAALRLAQTGAATGEPASAETEYRRYVTLAREYTTPPRPQLVITRGLSGSGKSTLARQLLRHWPAIHLRSDVERKRLFGLDMLARSDSALAAGIYTPQATAHTYDRLRALAGDLLDAGWPVLVDATFLDPAQVANFRALATARGVPFSVLDLRAPPETLRARVQQRMQAARDASEADRRVLEHQLEGYRPLPPETPGLIAVDTGEAVDAAALAARLAGTC